MIEQFKNIQVNFCFICFSLENAIELNSSNTAYWECFASKKANKIIDPSGTCSV